MQRFTEEELGKMKKEELINIVNEYQAADDARREKLSTMGRKYRERDKQTKLEMQHELEELRKLAGKSQDTHR